MGCWDKTNPAPFVVPVIGDFKAYFFRDFPYGTSFEQVQDQDIAQALQDAGINFNPGLAANQIDFSTFYLLLAAHYLVMNLSASAQGVAGQYTWIQSAKTVGSVSGAYAIPPQILNNATFAMLAQTRYGAKYILMTLPRMVGPIFSTAGRVHP